MTTFNIIRGCKRGWVSRILNSAQLDTETPSMARTTPTLEVLKNKILFTTLSLITTPTPSSRKISSKVFLNSWQILTISLPSNSLGNKEDLITDPTPLTTILILLISQESLSHLLNSISLSRKQGEDLSIWDSTQWNLDIRDEDLLPSHKDSRNSTLMMNSLMSARS